MIASVNKIIDSSIVDGPGNRCAIFFQQCNFNCMYCHNPETINKCINCGQCVLKCPVNALEFKDNKVVWDSKKCINCDTCIKTCPHNASCKISYMSVEQVYQKVRDNIPFIRGITTSGGECTLHAQFIKELFKLAKKDGLSTLMDSNGSYDFKNDTELMDVCDGIMLDIKATNDEIHQKLCGIKNKKVLDNARYLSSIHKLEEIRTVCIPGYLNDKETIKDISIILKDHLDEVTYKLIKYRHYGVREEYRYLNEPSDEYMQELKNYAIECGFKKIIII